MAYALDQMRHSFDERRETMVLGVYRDVPFLEHLLEHALYSVADHYRASGGVAFPVRLDVVEGESRGRTWKTECAGVNAVLKQADAMAAQEPPAT